MTTGKIIEVCTFRTPEGRAEYLLLKRSPEATPYPNIWQLVSGKVHPGESAVQAAGREFVEETGMALKNFWTVPFVDAFYDPLRDEVNLIPFFAAEVAGDANPVISPEHSTFEWLSFEDAQNRLVWPGQRLGLETVHRFIVTGEEAAFLTRVRFEG